MENKYKLPEDKEEFSESLSTIEGADGFLRDIRLIQINDDKPTLVIAERDFGESYADSEKVYFHFYDLEKNVTGAWMSNYSYLYRDSVLCDNKYKDVNKTIEKELVEKYWIYVSSNNKLIQSNQEMTQEHEWAKEYFNSRVKELVENEKYKVVIKNYADQYPKEFLGCGNYLLPHCSVFEIPV